MLQRLRAAFTPQALILLALLAAACIALTGENSKQTKSLEERLESTLSRIEGAGQVSVVIAMKSGGSKTASLLAQDQEAEETPCGAAVVAQGADDPIVRMQLTQAVCTVLGLPASAVSVAAGE